MSDDVRRAAERRSAMLKASNDHDGGYPDSDEGRKQSFYDMAILADAHVAYLAQQREDTTEGGYVGWTIVAEGEDGSLLLQSKTGARRRIWPPHSVGQASPLPDIRSEAERQPQPHYEGKIPWPRAAIDRGA